MNMKPQHWLILAGFIGAIGLQLSAVDQYADIVSPKFIAGILGQTAAVLTAMFTQKPERPWDGQDRREP